MNFSLQRHQARIARILLALFAMAWLNLIVQAPVHAAMKQSGHIPCHCDVTLCDTVLNMEDQSDNGVSGMPPVVDVVGQPVILLPVAFNQPAQVVIHYQQSDRIFRDHSPPPLSRTGILRI
jgi:hypothetical protein